MCNLAGIRGLISVLFYHDADNHAITTVPSHFPDYREQLQCFHHYKWYWTC